MKRTLAVDLGAGLVLPTPVVVASGCAGTGRELGGLIDLRKVGAVVSRSITLEPDRGTSTPRIAESASGAVWSTGLQNPGIDAFVAEELPRLARSAHVIVSIAGGSLEAYVRMTGALQGRLGLHVDRAVEIVGAVARMSLVPVFAKIPIWASDVVELSRGAVRAGAHGLVLGGPPPALSVQAERLRPALGAVTGWLSGPAIKPMMLRAVFEVARAVPDVPIVAVGGIRSGEDAIEAMLAGAWAVQAGTAVLIDPEAPVRIAQGVVRYLKAKGLASPADVRGRLRVPSSFGALEEEAAP